MKPRHWIMLLSLLATLALVFSLEDDDSELEAAREARPAKRASQRSEPQTSTATQPADSAATALVTAAGNSSATHYLAWHLLQGRATPVSQTAAPEADLFRAQHWYVPPPKTAAELAPPVPVAPEPGFAYMGKLEEGPQGTVILLASANRLYSVSVGERIDPNWRLDHEDEQSLGLTYLPLNLTKTLLKKSKVTVPNNPASHLQGDADDLQGNL